MGDEQIGAVTIPRELFEFLMGTGEIDGTSFGELNEGLPGRFWWRALLRTAERQAQGASEPWPGCFADLQRRRVTTLANLGLMLSKMAGGEAAEVVGYDAADLYAEVLMALAIEDADDTDIALEIARDHPGDDCLVAAAHAPETPHQRTASESNEDHHND